MTIYNTGPAKFDERGWRQDGVMLERLRQLHGYPRRQAVKYSAAEVQDLLMQFEMGFTVSEIAAYHERTENGIRMQIDRFMERYL